MMSMMKTTPRQLQSSKKMVPPRRNKNPTRKTLKRLDLFLLTFHKLNKLKRFQLKLLELKKSKVRMPPRRRLNLSRNWLMKTKVIKLFQFKVVTL